MVLAGTNDRWSLRLDTQPRLSYSRTLTLCLGIQPLRRIRLKVGVMNFRISVSSQSKSGRKTEPALPRFRASALPRFRASALPRFRASFKLTHQYITIPPVRSSCGEALLHPRRASSFSVQGSCLESGVFRRRPSVAYEGAPRRHDRCVATDAAKGLGRSRQHPFNIERRCPT